MKKPLTTFGTLLSLLAIPPLCLGQGVSWLKKPPPGNWMKDWTQLKQGLFVVRSNEARALSALGQSRWLKITPEEATLYTGQKWSARRRRPYLVRAVIAEKSSSEMLCSTYKSQVWIINRTRTFRPLPVRNCAVVVWLKFRPTEVYMTQLYHDYV